MVEDPKTCENDDFPQAEGLRRREFLTLGAMGSALAAVTASGCGAPATSNAEISAGAPPAFALEEATVAELQQRMEAKQLSSREITEIYLDRIEAVDGSLRSILEINPDALSIADVLDDERREGRVRGPLHGLPVLLKDNIDTADRMTTTAGSLALEGSIAVRDSHVAAGLRAAGAILLGKTNLSEWANFRSERSSSGWSGRGGQCRNPYVLDRSPCGSSSGSGAATSANLCALAIGTETNGSVVCPASACSLVGFKPTVGLWGRSGIIPIAHSQDTAGPMARCVADAVATLGVLTSEDARDPATQARSGEIHADYTQFLDADGLRGARIGIGRQFFGFHEGVDGILEAALETMTAAGAELIDEVELPELSEISRHSYQVLLYEFKANLNLYLANLGPKARVRSLEDLIRFNEENRDREMPYFEQEIFEEAQEKGDLSSLEYLEALRACKRLAGPEGIDAAMEAHRLDAIFAPTGGPPWKIDLINGDHFGGGSSTPAAVAGYPNITLPGGYLRGLPVGVNFFGRAWSEPTLIRIAYAFEQATRHRQAPRLLPSMDLGDPV